jgi:glutaredoxin
LSKAHVIVYSRPGCHLCDEAKEAIQQAGCSDLYTLEEVNIETDEELLRKYRYDIPVVTIDGVEGFRHRVDTREFTKFMRARMSAEP